MSIHEVAEPSGGARTEPGPASPEERRTRIGWGRAIVTGVAIVAVAFVGVIWLPDLILRQLSSLERDTRAKVAAIVSVFVVLAIAWALRRLQARGDV